MFCEVGTTPIMESDTDGRPCRIVGQCLISSTQAMSHEDGWKTGDMEPNTSRDYTKSKTKATRRPVDGSTINQEERRYRT
jgi:hypothetical protein